MEQRPLRLGDILDDYCPRERRLTNHAIVAMIEEDIRQTRCTTCDAEHAYKGGKVPKRRKKETPAALYKEVLAGMPETEAAPILTSAAHAASETVAIDPGDSAPGNSDGDAASAAELAPEAAIDQPAAAAVPQPQIQHMAAPAQPTPGSPSEDGSDGSIGAVEVEEGPVHRPLIRAQLPRIEGQ
jgi:hypothetical protein